MCQSYSAANGQNGNLYFALLASKASLARLSMALLLLESSLLGPDVGLIAPNSSACGHDDLNAARHGHLAVKSKDC
jgi:hypothetical protein